MSEIELITWKVEKGEATLEERIDLGWTVKVVSSQGEVCALCVCNDDAEMIVAALNVGYMPLEHVNLCRIVRLYGVYCVVRGTTLIAACREAKYASFIKDVYDSFEPKDFRDRLEAFKKKGGYYSRKQLVELSINEKLVK